MEIYEIRNKKSEGGIEVRVLILGPVVNEKTSGGVAVFDEGLCGGFLENGDEANILSIEKSIKMDNIVINIKKPNRIFFHKRKIAKAIKKYKPDLVISSLQYSIGIQTYKKVWSRAKYVQVLHGFPCPINGMFKSWLINKVARYSKKHFDYVVTVSFLSYAINKKINKIVCDKVIHNGCALTPSNNKKERKIDFIYVGRLFRDKEVEMIGEAFSLLKRRQPNLRFVVAGFGELEPLFTIGKFKNSGIEFVGKTTQNRVRELLEESKFFISMNPLEPFGIVFSEAVMNGCNIVTQSSNGSMALFMHKNYFHCADCLNGEELAEKLFNIVNDFHPISKEEKDAFVKYASFKRVAKEYKLLITRT